MSSRFERLEARTVFEGTIVDVREGTLPPRGRRGGHAPVGRAPRLGRDRRPRRRARLARAPAARGDRRARTCSSCPPASSTRRGRARWSAAGASWPRRSARPPAHWEHLTTYFTSAGFTDEQCHIFLATDLRDEPGHADRGRADRRSSRTPLAELDATIAELPRREDADRAAAAARRGCAERARCTGQARAPRRGEAVAVHGHRDAAAAHPAVRAPAARLPRLPRVRARPVAQHARGLPLRPAPVRRVARAHRPRPARPSATPS